MFIWGLLYSKCQLSKELVVKESSLWRLLFLIVPQQIGSSSWVDREAVWCVQRRRIGLKRNQEARLVLRPCPSCRGRKRVRNSVKQSQPSELYALHLHCQLSSSSNPGTALLRGAVWCCLCFTSRRSQLHRAKLLHLPQWNLQLLAKWVTCVWAVPSERLRPCKGGLRQRQSDL